MRSHINFLSKFSFLSPQRQFTLFLPFFLMRVKLEELDDTWNKIRIRLPLNWVSANAAGNMYGGYQASLADPVPAMICIKKFPGYRIATKKLEIDFIRVGNSDLILNFDFEPKQEESIRKELEERGSATPIFHMQFIREDGKVCSEIKNTVAIRPKGYVGQHE